MHSISNVDKGMTQTRPLIQDVPFHPGPNYRPPTKPIGLYVPRNQESSQSSPSTENINPDIILDFKKALFQKLIKDWTNYSFKNQKK